MAGSIFVMSPEAGADLDRVAASIAKTVEGQGKKAGIFRPVAKQAADAAVATVEEALELLRSGKEKQLLEQVVKGYYEAAAGCDLVICLGSECAAAPASFETELNMRLAASFDAPLAFVINGVGKTPAEVKTTVQSCTALAEVHGVDMAAFFLNLAECPCKNKCCLSVPVFFLGNDGYSVDAGFAAKVVERKGWRVTPVMFEYKLIEQARKHKMRIVLPEGTEPRILRAAENLTSRAVADIILLGDEAEVKAKIQELGLNMGPITIVNPTKSDNFEQYAAAYAEYRKAKGVTLEQARAKMADGSYYGSMMVKQGDADGMVSGSINTTAHTIRPAFEFIKTKPGFGSVSGVFLMCLKDKVLVFADCAVTPNPTTDQLAETAVASAETARVFGVEPRVAMLSYGTGNSGKGPSVDATIEATAKARAKAPDLAIEGPIQYDAAMVPEVAKTKLPDSPVAGKATVFIFPDLNAGNIGYKAVQRAANAIAIGPVLQGLNKPVNDLSRGCLVADIINTVAITAVQAQAEKGLL